MLYRTTKLVLLNSQSLSSFGNVSVVTLVCVVVPGRFYFKNEPKPYSVEVVMMVDDVVIEIIVDVLVRCFIFIRKVVLNL
jgi:hypothetical protein